MLFPDSTTLSAKRSHVNGCHDTLQNSRLRNPSALIQSQSGVCSHTSHYRRIRRRCSSYLSRSLGLRRCRHYPAQISTIRLEANDRSEERRVGKEWRSRWAKKPERKK